VSVRGARACDGVGVKSRRKPSGEKLREYHFVNVNMNVKMETE
jgi:hypothetical protein